MKGRRKTKEEYVEGRKDGGGTRERKDGLGRDTWKEGRLGWGTCTEEAGGGRGREGGVRYLARPPERSGGLISTHPINSGVSRRKQDICAVKQI